MRRWSTIFLFLLFSFSFSISVAEPRDLVEFLQVYQKSIDELESLNLDCNQIIMDYGIMAKAIPFEIEKEGKEGKFRRLYFSGGYLEINTSTFAIDELNFDFIYYTKDDVEINQYALSCAYFALEYGSSSWYTVLDKYKEFTNNLVISDSMMSNASRGVEQFVYSSKNYDYYLTSDQYVAHSSGKKVTQFRVIARSRSTGSATAQVTPPKTTPRPQTTPYIDNTTGRRYIYIDYKNVARNPELYKNTKVFLKGKVVQVAGSVTRGYDIRLATAGVNEDIYYIVVPAEKAPSFDILEGDNLLILCTLKGSYTYTTTRGSEVTQPYAIADSISLQE